MSRIGVEYKWKKNKDGTYTIFDVPVFQETVDSRNKDRIIKFDSKMIRDIVKENQRIQRENHHAPSIHIGHNGGGDVREEKKKVAEAVNFRTGNLFGKFTIFCDFSGITEEEFTRIKQGELPHVSVEITRSSKPRIGSIALLSSNAPYHTLPNIKVGEQVTNYKMELMTVYQSDDNYELISNFNFFGGAEMPKDKEQKEEIQMMESDGMEGGDQSQGSESGSLEEKVKKLEEMMKSFMEMMKKDQEEDLSEPSTGEAIPEADGKMAFGKIDMFMAIQEEVQKAIKPMKDELSSLKNYSKDLELEKQAEKALRYFDSLGIVIDPDNFKGKLREKVRKYGLEAGMEYIEEIREHGQRAPMGHVFEAGTINFNNDLDLTDYKKEGSEIYKKAQEAERFWMKNSSYFSAQGVSVEDFIEGEVSQIRLKKEGVI
jgi:hypothetical protein